MAKSTVIIPLKLKTIDKDILKAIEGAVNDVTDDLLRVAQQRTPVDTTTLEKSGTSKVTVSNKGIQGIVSFHAEKKGFNYAKQMDEKKYKLGKKSLSKAGARSKFTTSPLPVGSGYLSDTAKKCEDGYKNHINKAISEAIFKSGFSK